MKISKLFHWLYALLMFLPIVNVFAYTLRYGFNYGNEIPSVTENIQKTVDFNQIAHFYDNDVGAFIVEDYSNFQVLRDDSTFYANLYNDYFVSGHIFLLKTNYQGSFTKLNFWSSDYSFNVSLLTTPDFTFSVSSLYYFVEFEGDIDSQCFFNIFDLTKMFGQGNEPSLQQFNTWFSDSYYDYNLSEFVVIPDYSSHSVSDDVTNHFWLPSFGQVGYAINDVISFLLLNVFGLVVSEGIGFIVCGLFTYWTIISLAWLVFDILMYVPLLVHRWLDKAAIS